MLPRAADVEHDHPFAACGDMDDRRRRGWLGPAIQPGCGHQTDRLPWTYTGGIGCAIQGEPEGNAGEKGQRELAEARHGSEAILAEACQKAMQVTDLASKRGNELIAEAKNTAMAEGQRLVSQAKGEIANEQNRARDNLRKEVAALAVAGAAKVLGREVDAKAHAALLEDLAAELEKGAQARG